MKDPRIEGVVDIRRIGSLSTRNSAYNLWGGVNVDSTHVIHLYGDVANTYSLTKSISMNKFTRIQFTLYENESVQGVGICLYEFHSALISSESDVYCLSLRGGQLMNLSIPVEIPKIKGESTNELLGESINLALRRRTKQSSTFGPGNASSAVDGNTKPNFDYDVWELNSVSHTQKETKPWWEVDLAISHRIRKVLIYKCDGGYDGDLSDLRITLYDSFGNEVARRDIDDYSPKDFLVCNFDGSSGQKIHIMLLGDQERSLCLAEVKVLGYGYTFDVQVGKLFNFPELSINRVALIQEVGDNDVSRSAMDNLVEGSMSTSLKDFFITNDRYQEVAVSDFFTRFS